MPKEKKLQVNKRLISIKFSDRKRINYIAVVFGTHG